MRVKHRNAGVDSYNEAIRSAIANNPNFYQTPTCRGMYVGTAAAHASDPLYTPTSNGAGMVMGGNSMQPAPLPPRSQRMMPFYVEPVSAANRRRSRKARKQRPPQIETVRYRVRDRHGVLVDVHVLSSDSEASAGSGRPAGGRAGAAPLCRTSVFEFADDNFPPTNDASPAPAGNEIRSTSPESQAAVSTLITPRVRPRKPIRPERSPVM